MRELLVAEAYRCGADVSKVVTNTEEKAGDKGCDASTPGNTNGQSAWLSAYETCWQLKAGAAGQAAKLENEVSKEIPARTLRKGGRFVVVASRSVAGQSAIDERLKVLHKDAKKARLPVDKIEVFTSESLATWINEHPAVAALVRQMPGGFCTVEDWALERQHREPWVSTPQNESKIAQVRRDIDLLSGSVTHLHVYGRPGVGKTRFVLETCRGASWAKSVLYLPQLEDAQVGALLEAAARAPGTSLVLVVDEVPADQVRYLSSAAQRAGGRVRVVSIGHDGSPDHEAVAQVEVAPLDRQTMQKIVAAWHPNMPFEQTDYVANFADGYVRVARLAARAVAENPSLSTASLFDQSDVRQLMEAMLGNEHARRPLHVVALLSSVGWTNERAIEGRTIAAHLGLSWPDVQASVQEFQRRFGIAPRAGDLRYISPAPLGVYLALDALNAYPDLVRSLPDVLPNEQARRAYYERLQSVVTSPQAPEFADELSFFFERQELSNSGAVERWAALSGAHPARAARSALQALDRKTPEELRKLTGEPRRKLINGLVSLAWNSDAFHDAALSLARLALAENETYSNNATGEFVGLFLINMGQTATPYRDRLRVIDELTSDGDPSSVSLAVTALAGVGETSAVRIARPQPAYAPTPEWYPPTRDEHIACVQAAFAMLTRLAKLPGSDQSLVKAAQSVDMLLRESVVRNDVATFFRAIVASHPHLRELIRREVMEVLHRETKYWKQLPEPDVQWLEALHSEFEDKTAAGQLRQALASVDWELREKSLLPMAQRIALDPSPLWEEWAWLTSGNSGPVWDLGVALAQVDESRSLLPQMVAEAPRGGDLRIVSAYLHECATRAPQGWVDDWLDRYEQEHPEDAPLLFDVTWRCAPTSRGAERLTQLARANRLPTDLVAQLEYGPWVFGPSVDAVEELLSILMEDRANRPYVLALLEHRLGKYPDELERFTRMGLDLVSDPDLVRARQMTSYYWQQLSERLVAKHPKLIARTIFEAQAEQGERVTSWFITHSEAAGVLQACIRADRSGVWEVLAPFLENRKQAGRLAVGFPTGMVDELHHDTVLDWIAEDVDGRARLVARMAAKSFDDGSLGAKILERFSGVEGVGDTFFGAFVSGSWSGPTSTRWETLAGELDTVASKTSYARLRRWAKRSAVRLRDMARSERKREEEEELRDWV